MIQQTINGKDVIIIERLTGTYLVICWEGEQIETLHRPITDQEISQEISQTQREITSQRGRILGDILVELLTPLLH